MLSIMLVDDEISSINGISYALQKYENQYSVVASFQSAQEALAYLQLDQNAHNLDVVITDIRMPDMDGIELTGILQKKYPHLVVIALSGYSDYDLVRQCLKNGAIDYLLKPFSLSALLTLLENTAETKTKQKAALQLEALKQSIHLDAPDSESFPSLFSSDVHLHSAIFAAPQGSIQEDDLRKYLPQANSIPDLTFPIEHQMFYISRSFASEPAFCEFLNSLWCSLAPVYPGLCILSAFRDGIPQDDYYSNLLVCQKASDFMLFNGKSGVYAHSTWESFIDQPLGSFKEKAEASKSLAVLLWRGDKESFSAQMFALANELRHEKALLKPISTRKHILRMMLSLENDLERTSSENVHVNLHTSFLQAIQQARTRSELAGIIEKLSMEFCNVACFESSMPRYIHSAIEYIRNNYMKDIRLSEVSEYVYINEWYLSTQFKKYCGITFKEFLNQTRIEAAKELLLQPDLKLWQIAEMIGIRDATYFTSVFKKHTNMTPKEYQKVAAKAFQTASPKGENVLDQAPASKQGGDEPT